jgi:Flp pilus assembly protein TadD
MLWAEASYSNGECARAVPPLRRVIVLAPRTATPRVMLAECLAAAGDLAGAERLYAAALAVHPYHARALQGAADLYRRGGDLQATRVLLQRLSARPWPP